MTSAARKRWAAMSGLERVLRVLTLAVLWSWLPALLAGWWIPIPPASLLVIWYLLWWADSSGGSPYRAAWLGAGMNISGGKGSNVIWASDPYLLIGPRFAARIRQRAESQRILRISALERELGGVKSDDIYQRMAREVVLR